MSLTVTIHDGLADIPAADWDATGAGRNPFTTHRFLLALEQSGSVGKDTGWQPAHLCARQGEVLRGVAPCYAKTNSQGEYIFDHAWADAFQRAGGRYYPKLQCAVPFTPVTGPRLIAPEPEVRRALLAAMMQICRQNGLSGAHVTFCEPDEVADGEAAGFLARKSQQFHWLNDGYASYDDFLAQLSSRKRKDLRKERARAQGFGGTIRQLRGDEILPAHWDAFWRFYQDTGARKWGRPYLTRAFFDLLHQTMRDDCLLVLAERDGQPIAGALNLIGPQAIYGRYWGAIEDHPFLHFELCYHQAIDFAIAHGLSRVEAGAQGEHKLARGYLPVATHSLHWLADPGFHGAVADYLDREGEAMEEQIAVLRDWGPFRRGEPS
ncbi:GNAT family N-acetyltransferase [Paracoccus jeotgali]|uniref:GNAT family N-acetyltransferase n=1 Tax=Paracoccus jeotgali TaxID=2065379 RepID=A0A2K9MCD4_9RHOB|nr:GNAT family N-acetyltransferase [Paracoccus jeotgali]AUM73263.1 GNAT family N-acetyltransferase [Paracoccus jeotgali]